MVHLPVAERQARDRFVQKQLRPSLPSAVRGLLLGLLMTLAGCEATTPALPTGVSVDFTERDVGPLKLGDVALLTLKLESTHDLEVRGVGFVADAGLRVRYLGFTRCRPDCLAAGRFNIPAQRRQAEQSLEGTVPFVIPAEEARVRRAEPPLRLVFTVEVTVADWSAREPRCLYVRFAELQVEGGARIRAPAFDGAWIAAAKPEDTPDHLCEVS